MVDVVVVSVVDVVVIGVVDVVVFGVVENCCGCCGSYVRKVFEMFF